MRPRDCDRSWEIEALREGSLGAKDAGAFERHARACDRCSAILARDAKLRHLAASLQTKEPDPLALRRLRARVLHDVATRPPRGRSVSTLLRVALAGVVLFGAISWGLLGRHPSAAPSPVAAALSASAPGAPEGDLGSNGLAAKVAPSDGARWSRVREGITESVRLEDGTLWIHVRHQVKGERFLVLLPDGELEVRGTTFEVSVRGGATERVHVEEGTVALRILTARGEIELTAGQTWDAPHGVGAGDDAPSSTRVPPKDTAKSALSVPQAASPRKGGAPAPSARVDEPPESATDDGAEAYVAAIALMQSARYAAAASAFRAFALAHPQAPQAEDASFLEAVALARAGRSDAAALAAENHLARFPKSFHHKEAAVLIARAARDRGDCDQARSVLAPWLGSTPDAEARATVETCLERDR